MINEYEEWVSYFEDGEEGEETKDEETKDENKKIDEEQQKRINSIIRSEKIKFRKELETMKDKYKLVESDKEILEKKIEELRKETMTKEELAKEKVESIKRNYSKEVQTLKEQKDSWKSRYSDLLVKQAILEGCSENNAFNSNQIIPILKPNSRIVEEIDEATNKQTGIFKVKTTFVDKEGKSLELSPQEAVKRMREMPEYLNLFKSNLRKGLNDFNHNIQVGEVDITKLTPSEYAEKRRKGEIKL